VCGEIVERLSEALPETKSRFALWAARRGAMSAFEIAQRGFIIKPASFACAARPRCSRKIRRFAKRTLGL
jgi:hypothetical protein